MSDAGAVGDREVPVTERNKQVVRRLVDEVYVFRLSEGRITNAWCLEDTWRRLRQLGLVREGVDGGT